ncbi:hypothetical protein K378_00491 [Streptomyces sp. Amel2xB2]|uniref:hypothetical protein n=1 Tax=Streptomyces sp. Amel2xB2 TaxID=1305829 RepID=UPI000DC01E9F|nr:hypothetical protein [Streptomyces sp. Amel2xB2]RAJ71671.1 hypothetical protein K378_00491 [Streptomyces sp. Amel2xB2]
MAADETPRPEPSDPSARPSPHIRLRVDLVVEIADAKALTGAALEHVARDELMPDEEREHTEEIISADAGEALACLVDPFDLVRELPGVELAHASWGSEEMDAGELEAFSFLEEDGGPDEDGDEVEDESAYEIEEETEYGIGDETEDETGDETAYESEHEDAYEPEREGAYDGTYDPAYGDLPASFRENVHGLDGASR